MNSIKAASLLIFFVSLSALAQDQNQMFDILFPIEQNLQSASGSKLNIGSLSTTEITNYFKDGGVELSSEAATTMKSGIQALESLLTSRSPATISSIISTFSRQGITLTADQAQNILNHIGGGKGVKVGQNAHVYLMALLAKSSGAVFIKFLQEVVEEANRPSRPDSPVRRSIGRILNRTLSLQKHEAPKTSGDWFNNAYTSIGYTYTDFRDSSINSDGNENIIDLTFGGDISDSTSLSFSLSRQKSRQGGDVSLSYESLGGDAVLHHKFNETFGAGVFGFYQQTDIEEIDGDVYGTGGGVLVSAFHDFGYFDITTVHSLSKVYYQYGHDQLYVGALTVNRNWNDSFSTFLTGAYTDSLKEDQGGDNSYWTVGAGFNWFINENLTFSFEYNKVLALSDYRNHSFHFNLRWNF